MAYDFHYTPTGTGVISGKEVLEQTEDAINDLGNTAISGVQEALDKAEQALTNSENAVDDAQTALNTANNAEGVAIQAQTDVGNLSGTVTNIGNRVTTAEGNITNLQGRMTTAEGNITNLQGRMTTAETNIGNLQTAVSTAQATANSAQQTATTARQQSYVFRYSSTALTPSSTNSNALLDNTDNLKVGDKVIDSSGVLFSITAIDTQNSTFTIGTALIDLAKDSDVVHKSGNETVGGEKTFTSSIKGYNSDSTQSTVSIDLRTSKVSRGSTSDGVDTFGFGFKDKNNNALASISCVKRSTGGISEYHTVNTTNSSNNVLSESYSFNLGKDGNSTFRPETNDKTLLGTSTNNWKGVYATNYYYGSNNVEFSTKFVTTDTAQTISGQKVFSDINAISSSSEIGVSGGNNSFKILDKNKKTLSRYEAGTFSSGMAYSYLLVNNGSDEFNGVSLYQPSANLAQLRPYSSTLSLQLGASNRYFSDCYTSKINGLTPSSLGMPDINNRIDISSYITDLTGVGNEYTPSVNGWICVRSANANKISILDSATFVGNTSISNTATYLTLMTPCVANRKVFINIMCTSLDFAYFIPCQGNI